MIRLYTPVFVINFYIQVLMSSSLLVFIIKPRPLFREGFPS